MLLIVASGFVRAYACALPVRQWRAAWGFSLSEVLFESLPAMRIPEP
jgi:hypothetical protein